MAIGFAELLLILCTCVIPLLLAAIGTMVLTRMRGRPGHRQ